MMSDEKYIIVRLRYNSETEDYDQFPTIFGADTHEEAEAIVACLNARNEAGLEEDCFAIESV
jgi:hypothetical protein